MPELMRFRIARAPQRRVPDELSILRLQDPRHGSSFSFNSVVKKNSKPNLSQLQQQLKEASKRNADVAFLLYLDEFLAANNNRVEPAVIKKAMKEKGVNIDPQPWQDFYQALGVVVLDACPGVCEYILRLILVAGLIEVILKGDPMPKTQEDVYDLLRWRTVALPDKLVTMLRESVNTRRMGKAWKEFPAASVFARRPGFTDLYITSEDWYQYEPGEIARITNVLPGEAFVRRRRELDETVTSLTTDTTTSKSEETDSQTTDRTSLQTSSSNDTKLALHVDGKVDVSAQYGPAVKIDAHVGGSLDYSQSQSTSRAITQSHETIDRAVRSVTETVRQIRSTQTTVRIVDSEKHAIDNSEKSDAINGVYLWVNKRSNVLVTRYPHRFLMEFVIPEPGAWLRWLHDKTSELSFETPIPASLTDTGKWNVLGKEPDPNSKALTPGMLSENKENALYYLTIGGRYSTLGLEPPPPKTCLLTGGIAIDATSNDSGSTQNQHYSVDNKTIQVPDGYEAVSWGIREFSWCKDASPLGARIRVVIGGSSIQDPLIYGLRINFAASQGTGGLTDADLAFRLATKDGSEVVLKNFNGMANGFGSGASHSSYARLDTPVHLSEIAGFRYSSFKDFAYVVDSLLIEWSDEQGDTGVLYNGANDDPGMFPYAIQGGTNGRGFVVHVRPQHYFEVYASSLSASDRDCSSGGGGLKIGPISSGALPIAVQAINVTGYSFNVEVSCVRTAAALTAWQIGMFDSIQQAYYAMKRQADKERADAKKSAADNLPKGSTSFGDENNPEWNQKLVAEELKRQVIEFFLGAPFNGRDAIQEPDENAQGPELSILDAVKHSAEIEFLEQSFEWENLSFVLYPYFWTARDRWKDIASIKGNDTDFANFLRAGAARVVVPARPGFESQVALYADLGILWGGGPTPAPGDEEYLSIADEIKAQQQRPTDGVPVESWQVVVPTILTWLQTDKELPLMNDQCSIPYPLPSE